MIKTLSQYTAVLLFFITATLHAQTPITIIKPEPPATNYTVTAATGPVTLIATQSIILSPNTHIQAGSTFVAKVSSDAYISLTPSKENYIFTRTFQAPMTDPAAIVNNSDVIENITYFDGLGRPMQSIAIKASPTKQDLVVPILYDGFGRQDKEYLPYMEKDGLTAAFRNNTTAVSRANTHYGTFYSSDFTGVTPNPFSQKAFEDSPLNRVLQQAAPGKDWAIGSGHEIKLDYVANTDADAVKLYAVSTSLDTNGVYVPSVTVAAYAANQLYKTVTKNENWIASSGTNNTTEEFKDKEGRVVLKRTYNNGAHDTYYVYDNYGNLTLVLPPKAEGLITELTLKDLCYQYRYDDRNRLIEKKLPGKEWEYIVYDKLDRPILTQDVNLRDSNKWMFTKYDAFSRPVYTGEYTNTTEKNRADIQRLANGTVLFESKQTVAINIAQTSVNYTNVAFPNTGIDLLTISYYDDYSFDLDGSSATTATNVKGLATGSKIRVLGTTSWTTNVNYYDDKGRPIYSYSKNNYLGTVSTSASLLDFGGKPLETTTTHKKGTAAEIKIVDAFTYDHMSRLLNQKQTINNQTPELIATNSYDNLGQLDKKSVGGKTTQSRLQTISYGYNIRGWLKNINNINAIGSNLFAFQINYNDSATGKLYNGNISQTLWKTANTDSSLKSYAYTYDALNRLTLANDISTLNPGRYNEGLDYDKNGNIMNLTRLGHRDINATSFGNMDILAYTYDNGNKLIKVEDSSGSTEGFKNGVDIPVEYGYDFNGNMTNDANKGISAIAYNYLSLPTKITFPSGTIDYVYDATGVKQRKIISTGITTDYAGGFIYENNTLQFFSQPEGYVSNNSGTYEYIYQYKDHLGNVRLSYDKNLSIVEENNYYPFGLKQKGYNGATVALGNATAQKYKYNGKELQDDNINGFQLNLYDYHARNYDPALGRWMNIDPLAETSRRFSSFTYALNNPVFFIDPDGMEATNSYEHNSGNINGRHQTWSDRHQGSFANENYKEASMFENPELPETKTSQKSIATASDIEEVEDGDPPKKKRVLDAKTSIIGKIWFTLEKREWTDPETGVVYQVSADGTTFGIRPLGGAGMLGNIGIGGGVSILKFKGLIQNMPLRGLTHQQLVKAFGASGFSLSGHAIKRLKDIRTSNLGFNTLNDIKQIFNKGVSFDAGSGSIGKSYKGLEVIWNAETKIIVTIRPAKNIR
ncbi:DUF6443 domain-containing protein [Flavobacterium hydatis]|uniref:RHS repeat-associated core domain-containing protein n=1 Tax=Flavobacterium hydatis TaxID=991 RepID=A0ABX4CH85_FLAHY|nr:DUF6443 domain-containing protein [Flavobacterium hydatis]OXA94262.1 RHS repeat-associated core domain-containing protein [Flavobacterium hydatis]